ncbi:MAG: hypothetical protein LDL27_12870 [Desulfovibrio sp.]|nr:hypothetical protein [Desulfovibrio sp.]
MQTISVNITAKVVNAISQAYRTPPMRELEAATAGAKTLFADIAEGCALDARLLHKAGAIPLEVFLMLLQERGWLPPSVDVAGIVAAKEARRAEVQAAMAGMDLGTREWGNEDRG